jgi:hypothetical protein
MYPEIVMEIHNSVEVDSQNLVEKFSKTEKSIRIVPLFTTDAKCSCGLHKWALA